MACLGSLRGCAARVAGGWGLGAREPATFLKSRMVASAALALAVSFAGCHAPIQLPSEAEPPQVGPIAPPSDGGVSNGGLSDGGLSDGGVPDGGIGDVINPNFPGYRLVFDEEFDGTALDESKWHISVGPYNDGLLSRDSVAVANGFAKLTTYTEAGVHH